MWQEQRSTAIELAAGVLSLRAGLPIGKDNATGIVVEGPMGSGIIAQSIGGSGGAGGGSFAAALSGRRVGWGKLDRKATVELPSVRGQRGFQLRLAGVRRRPSPNDVT